MDVTICGYKSKILEKKEGKNSSLNSYIRPINPKESPTVLICVTKANFHKTLAVGGNTHQVVLPWLS